MTIPFIPRIGLGAYYDLLYADRGFGMAPHHFPPVAALEDFRVQNLLLLGPPGTGKSNLLLVAYASWLIGHQPDVTVLSISAGEALPQGFMSAVMQIVQHNKVFRELFPTVEADPAQGWSIQRGLFVTGHPYSDSDATYKAVGVSSKALTGFHARTMLIDDIHDRENAYTPESRQLVKDTFYNTLMGRMDPKGCRMIAAGRWWAPDDIYQEWIENGDFVVMSLPASRPGNADLWYDVLVPRDLECIFTETLEPEQVQDPRSPYVRYRAYYGARDATKRGFYWPASPSKRREYETVKRRQPRTAAINYDGDMSGGGDAIFHESDFRPFLPPEDLSSGVASPHVRRWAADLKGDVEEAWDTALGQPQSSSLTVALTGLLVPCSHWHRGEDSDLLGPCDFHYDVFLLDIMARSLDFGALAKALRSRFGLWHPRRVIVEEKQSGVGLLQTFRGTHIPVFGQKVEEGKVERAVNPVIARRRGDESGQPIGGGAASVQGWARMGRILVPAGATWLRDPHGDAKAGFLDRVTSFTGGSGKSDEFDALVHLVTRAIVRSRQRTYMPGVDDATAEVSAMDAAVVPFGQEDPRTDTLDAFRGLAAQATDPSRIVSPFDGMCGSCGFYAVFDNAERCRRHGTVVSAMHGCSDWARHGSVAESN